MINYSKHIIYNNDTIRTALEKINNIPENLTLFVLNKSEQLIGTVTDGDIRRALLIGKNISDSIESVMFKDFYYIKNKAILKDIKNARDEGVKLVPLLDENNRILKVFNFNKIKSILPVDVVIMAGGRGERLRPLTDNTPKPLLKLGNKSIIEHNIDRLIEFGIENFYITVKYLSEQIIDYLGQETNNGIKINYIKEEKSLGTIGSVSLIKKFKHGHILVTNADLFTNIDFEDFYQNFINQNADMAVASIPYNVNIPYAVLKTDNNGNNNNINAVELRNPFIREMKLFQFYLVLTPEASFRTNLFNRLGEYLL